MSRVQAGEVQLGWREWGKGDVTVVFIHGNLASKDWIELAAPRFPSDLRVIGIDWRGCGDSDRPQPAADYSNYSMQRHAEDMIAALDALGIERFDLYGTHTGGSIAAEIAIQAPQRVRKLILDGIGLYPDELQAELLDRYAPAMKPDLHGGHINWVWHFVRDTYMFWPWYATDAVHRRSIGLPPPEVLHDKVLDVLKAIETYHLSYRAAFRYDKREQFKRIRVPTMAACAANDMLAQWHDEFAALIPGAVKTVIPAVTIDPAGAAAALAKFLDS